MKQAGLVGTRRGKKGGHYLKKLSSIILVGELPALLEGPVGPIKKLSHQNKRSSDKLEIDIELNFKDFRVAIRRVLCGSLFEDGCLQSQEQM